MKLMCLDDYKLTSTYAIQDGCKPEWEAQLNIYALMLREHGYVVERLRIVAILRDWQKAKSKHTPGYPQVPAVLINVPMWPTQKTEAYIKDRLIAHGTAQHKLPECTPDERWERPAVFALHKIGNKRATKLFDTADEADTALAEIGQGYEIQLRPAEQKRCADFCPVLSFCLQGQKLIKATEEFRLAQHWTVSRPRSSAAA